MLGSATGDGTLSDSWISEINGPLQTPNGSKLQLAWYDEQGGSSTSHVLPSGWDLQLDQYGSMYALYTGEDRESAPRAFMVANDHGKEGFIAGEPTVGGYSDGNLGMPGDTNRHAMELAAGTSYAIKARG